MYLLLLIPIILQKILTATLLKLALLSMVNLSSVSTPLWTQEKIPHDAQLHMSLSEEWLSVRVFLCHNDLFRTSTGFPEEPFCIGDGM
jgi:hypothetical protein